MESKPISKLLLGLNACLLIAVIGTSFAIAGFIGKTVKKEIDEKKDSILMDYFNKLPLQAKAVYVFDIKAGEMVYEKNATARLPLASLTKLMTALVASELAPLTSRITIQKEFLVEDGDTGLLSGEVWKLKDLIDFSLIVSSNDGARAIASAVGAIDIHTNDYTLGRKNFIDKMNLEAKKLDLKETSFINESGLDEGNTSGGYGSAVDVANLLRYIVIQHPTLLEATKLDSTTISSFTKKHLAKNTDESIGEIPGLIASKTGYTALAGGNLAIAFDASIGRPIIIVVLDSTESGRFTDMNQLVTASLSYISN